MIYCKNLKYNDCINCEIKQKRRCSNKHLLVDECIFLDLIEEKLTKDEDTWALLNKAGDTYIGYVSYITLGNLFRRIQELKKDLMSSPLGVTGKHIRVREIDIIEENFRNVLSLILDKFKILTWDEKDTHEYHKFVKEIKTVYPLGEPQRVETHDIKNWVIALNNQLTHIKTVDKDNQKDQQILSTIARRLYKYIIKLE